MPRACTICSHPARDQIDAGLATGVGNLTVAKRFGLSKDAVRRHHLFHLPQTLVRAAGAREATRSDGLLGEVTALQVRATTLLETAERVGRQAERKRDGRLTLKSVATAARALGELRSLLALLVETGIALSRSQEELDRRVRAELESALDTAEGVLPAEGFNRLMRAWAAATERKEDHGVTLASGR